LEELLAECGEPLDAAIELQVNDDVLVDRIVGRAAEAAAAGQPVRADDNEESLKVRLMAYYKQTSPLIGYYHAKGILKGVDGLGEMAAVKADIAQVLNV
jgi:adenylate kinase